MKKFTFIAASLVIFTLFNYSIYQKEKLRPPGYSFYLELSSFHDDLKPGFSTKPNHIILQYRIEESLRNGLLLKKYPNIYSPYKASATPLDHAFNDFGYLVLACHDNSICSFIDLYTQQPLAQNEMLIPYYKINETHIELEIPHKYPTHGKNIKSYMDAKFAEVKFDSFTNQFSLVSLTNLDLTQLNK
jgi:hypothetical protein